MCHNASEDGFADIRYGNITILLVTIVGGPLKKIIICKFTIK